MSSFVNPNPPAGPRSWRPFWLVSLLALALPVGALAQGGDTETMYRTIFGLSPRLVVWIVAELHLMFAAFVLGVPIFAVIIEVVGVRQKKEAEFAKFAHQIAEGEELSVEEERDITWKIRGYATAYHRALRYDALAFEFTRLLSTAFATTAALGGLLAFTLISAYTSFMAHLTGVFHHTFFLYDLL